MEAWWLSTQGLVERLVYLMETIMLHERMDDIASLLSSVESCALIPLMSVLDPFLDVQKKPESNKVIEPLVIPLIWGLHTSLMHVLDDL